MLLLFLKIEELKGACPGDHPYATKGIFFSKAVRKEENFTNPIQEVQMVDALSKVFFEYKSLCILARKIFFKRSKRGLNSR
jgi:hypothetical protein